MEFTWETLLSLFPRGDSVCSVHFKWLMIGVEVATMEDNCHLLWLGGRCVFSWPLLATDFLWGEIKRGMMICGRFWMNFLLWHEMIFLRNEGVAVVAPQQQCRLWMVFVVSSCLVFGVNYAMRSSWRRSSDNETTKGEDEELTIEETEVE